MSKTITVGYTNIKEKSVIGGDDMLDWSAHDNCAHIPNAETIAVMEEMEEMVRKIRAGDRSGCMTFEEYIAEKRRWLEEDGYEEV